MRSAAERFILGDLVWWLIAGIVVLVVIGSPFVQSDVVFDAIHLSIVALVLGLVGIRSLIRRRIVPSNALLAVWLVIFTGLVLVGAPREIFLAWFLVALVTAAALYLRKAEF